MMKKNREEGGGRERREGGRETEGREVVGEKYPGKSLIELPMFTLIPSSVVKLMSKKKIADLGTSPYSCYLFLSIQLLLFILSY